MGGMMILWIIILLLSIFMEALTMGLTTIWFAGGALAALIVEMLSGSIYLQISVFLIVSLVLLYFTRPVAVRYFNKERVKTNIDGLIGKQAVVTETIHNLKGTGQVTVAGQEWTARSSDEARSFEEGEIVKIVAIKGVKLMVEADEKESAVC